MLSDDPGLSEVAIGPVADRIRHWLRKHRLIAISAERCRRGVGRYVRRAPSVPLHHRTRGENRTADTRIDVVGHRPTRCTGIFRLRSIPPRRTMSVATSLTQRHDAAS